jgi:hypothetical protein
MFGKFAVALGTAFEQSGDHRHRDPGDENSMRFARQKRKDQQKVIAPTMGGFRRK